MDFDISVSGEQITIKPKSQVFFTNEEFQKMVDECRNWRRIANRLGTHLGEGLYSEDNWDSREYAIAAFAEWEDTDGAQLYGYDLDPQPVWWFRNGEEV